MSKTIERYNNLCNKIAQEFAVYMGFDPKEAYAIGQEPSGTWDMWDWYHYFSIYNMVDILTERYTVDVIEAHYEYEMICGEEDFHLNLYFFNKFFNPNTDTAQSFLESYKEKRRKNKEYWSSPEWKKKESENMAKLQEKFLKDLWL